MKSINEKSVRAWLRDNWPGDIWWAEAAAGGSAGIPDATLSGGPIAGLVGMELKVWRRTSLGIRCEIRPTQRRYHRKAAACGIHSAVLFAILPSSDLQLGMLPGRAVPIDPYPRGFRYYAVESKEKFVDLLSGCYGFWGDGRTVSSLYGDEYDKLG